VFALTHGLLPAADVHETKDEFVIEIELPGFEQKELAIEVTEHTFVVKGERIEANEAERRTETVPARRPASSRRSSAASICPRTPTRST
jgi:HSP20 family protein